VNAGKLNLVHREEATGVGKGDESLAQESTSVALAFTWLDLLMLNESQVFGSKQV